MSNRAHRRNIVPAPARIRWLRNLVVIVMASIASGAIAQSPGAERQFRQWASDSVEVLSKSRDAAKRTEAAQYLGSFTYPDVRAAAAGALWDSGKASEPARSRLIHALEDPSASVVVRAAGALQMLGVPEAELAGARRRVFE